jgi:hypothetical protein
VCVCDPVPFTLCPLPLTLCLYLYPFTFWVNPLNPKP